MNSSRYVESQGEFAVRFAREKAPRLDFSSEVALANQLLFMEPRVRVSADPLIVETLGWTESAARKQLAEFYRENLF